jgi:hypothetical protein
MGLFGHWLSKRRLESRVSACSFLAWTDLSQDWLPSKKTAALMRNGGRRSASAQSLACSLTVHLIYICFHYRNFLSKVRSHWLV